MKLCHAQITHRGASRFASYHRGAASLWALLLGAACTPTNAPAPPVPGDVNLCVWPRACYLVDGTCRRIEAPPDMGGNDLGYGQIVQQVPGDLGSGDMAGTSQQGPQPTDPALVCPLSINLQGSVVPVTVTCALPEDACPALGPACSAGCARSGQAVTGQVCMGPAAAPIHSAFGDRCRYPDDVCCHVVDAGIGDGGAPRDAAPQDM